MFLVCAGFYGSYWVYTGNALEKCFNATWREWIFRYENYLGFDTVRRLSFTLLFRRFNEKVFKETSEDISISTVEGLVITGWSDTGMY